MSEIPGQSGHALPGFQQSVCATSGLVHRNNNSQDCRQDVPLSFGSFTSFRAGTSYLNLIAQPAERHWSWWGRLIFYVADVDALYDRALGGIPASYRAPRCRMG
jgi:hypothetical protein